MAMKNEQFIERRIVTGLIISTEFLSRIRKVWNSKLLGSRTARLIANWCIEFFDQYHKAPGQEIESIFLGKTKKLKEEDASGIEDILTSLSDEYEHQDKFNVDYLLDQATQYLDERHLREFVTDITQELDEGNILEAKKNANAYKPAVTIDDSRLDLSSKEELQLAVEKAFNTTAQPVLRYERQLGDFMNSQLIRGGFVAFMGMEKRGKSFLMMDMAVRAARQKANVAYFQAGDMTQDQVIKRISVHVSNRSDKPTTYKDRLYEPVRDCIWNQLNTCTLKERECDFGPFEGKEQSFVRDKITYGELIAAHKDNRDYRPCYNCDKYWTEPWGAVWLKKIKQEKVLTAKQASKVLERFFVESRNRMRLATYPSGTLRPSDIDTTLDLWEKEDGFVADMIIVDFADIMASDLKGDFRHQENDKWMRLRALSQKRHALVVTATWTDAASYDKDRLSLKNFSEDKRKYGHVTAMYGLNQDHEGREKEIGIMRINQIVIREESFLNTTEVYVLQNLRKGQPCLSSYW